MFRKVNLCLFWLVGLCAVLVIGITGCGEGNENPLTEEDDSALVEKEKEEVNPYTKICYISRWI